MQNSKQKQRSRYIDSKPKQRSRSRYIEKKESVWSILRPCIITVAAVILFTTFIARPSRVVGPSMQDTCHNGDLVILWELNYNPARGDIVVVDKDNPLHENLIKRVIGVGGDHVQVQDGTVTVNGQQLSEPYVKESKWSGSNVDLVVPEGQVFLMGDNRNNSEDSRAIGPVDSGSIMGKVVLRIFPFDAIRTF